MQWSDRHPIPEREPMSDAAWAKVKRHVAMSVTVGSALITLALILWHGGWAA